MKDEFPDIIGILKSDVMKSPLFYLALSFVSLLSYAQQKNSIGMEFVKIPSGTFYMGDHGLGENRDEAPVHPVTSNQCPI